MSDLEDLTVETESLFAEAIREHLDLKAQNSRLDDDMPLDPYLDGDPMENHPLFKSEEQARIEETLDGEPAAELSSDAAALARRGDCRAASRALPSTRRSGRVARATSTGATEPSRPVTRAVTPDERLRRYAELAVRVGANVQPGQDVVVTVPRRARGDRASGGSRGVPRRRSARRRPLLRSARPPRSDRARPGGRARVVARRTCSTGCGAGRGESGVHLADREPRSRAAERPRSRARRPLRPARAPRRHAREHRSGGTSTG